MLIEAGNDVNRADGLRGTPLLYAVQNNQTALMFAAENSRNSEVVQVLIGARAGVAPVRVRYPGRGRGA